MAIRSTPTRSIRRWRAVGLALVLAAGLAACGDDDGDVDAADTTSTAASGSGGSDDGYGDRSGGDATGSTVVAEDFAFSSATVAPGAEVAFENKDDAPHTMTADDGAFDTGDVEGGGSEAITAPSQPGEYAFHCEIHASMTGTLTVEG